MIALSEELAAFSKKLEEQGIALDYSNSAIRFNLVCKSGSTRRCTVLCLFSMGVANATALVSSALASMTAGSAGKPALVVSLGISGTLKDDVRRRQ